MSPEILRCPLHPNVGLLQSDNGEYGSLVEQPSPGSAFRCAHCGHLYATVAGIPDLFVSRERADYFDAEARQWDEQARAYEVGRGRDLYYLAAVDAAIESLRAQPGELVLDAGCGTGMTTRRLSQKGVRVVGLDLSLQSLRYQREVAPEPAVPLVRGDVTVLPFPDETFDRVLCANTLQQLPDGEHRQRCIAELARVARPGARIVVTTHNYSVGRRKAGWPKDGPAGGHSGRLQYVHRLEVNEFQDLLRSAFVVTSITGAAFTLPYRFKLTPISRRVEWILRRWSCLAAYGGMLIGVCERGVSRDLSGQT